MKWSNSRILKFVFSRKGEFEVHKGGCGNVLAMKRTQRGRVIRLGVIWACDGHAGLDDIYYGILAWSF